MKAMLRRQGLCAAGLVLLVAGGLAAKEPLAECGTYFTAVQEEMFLHVRHLVSRARRPQAAEAAPRAAGVDRDIGDIAVIDSGGGVIAKRNRFNLSNRTLRFTPGEGGYSAETLLSDTYDAAASSAGARLTLGDDDTQRISLPFPLTFYGVTYQEAFVNSNGTLTFTTGDLDYSGSFGHFTAGAPAIAALFTDLDPPNSGSGVRLLSEAERVVITWDSIPLATSSFGTNSAQLRIFPSGIIEFAFGSANPSFAVVGITPGGGQPVTMVDFASVAEPSLFPSGIAESFSALDEVDMAFAAQRFYETHDDAYDYLVFYNAAGVDAGPGVVAFELTLRSSGKGYGDFPINVGTEFGSPRRLQAVLNMGPVTQYPLDPNARVPSRGVVGDTPLTVLGHEAGHLFLALVSVPNPDNPFLDPPMLGAGFAHWAFPFNSEASLLEGNRIADDGTLAFPRFRTTGTVEGYSPLDQYLMGFRPPEEVPPTFAVMGSGQSNSRPPETGVGMTGRRFDIRVEDIIHFYGPRTPDSTVAQRRFRFAFIVIVPEGADLSPGSPAANAVAQVETYRTQFEPFYTTAAGNRAIADTTLRRAVQLSLAPAGGVALEADGMASIELDNPAASALTFSLETPNGVLSTASSVTIGAGQTRTVFAVTGNRIGVEDLSAIPSDPAYHTARARVQVESVANLHLEVTGGAGQEARDGELPEPVTVRVVDRNDLPYSGLRVRAEPSPGTSVDASTAVTGPDGTVAFRWTVTAGSFNTLRLVLEASPGVTATVNALGRPAISSQGVVHGATFQPGIAPGAFGTIFGGSLAAGAFGSVSAPFPTSLADVSVTIGGIPARMVFVSDTQLNFLAPNDLAPGPQPVVVQTPLGSTDPVTVAVEDRRPGIFFDAASGYGAILIAGTTSVTQVRPAPPGEAIEIYCTGLGLVVDRSMVTARIGGVEVEVLFAGPTFIPGLQQVNVRIPDGIPAGAQDLVLTVAGVESNTVKVGIGGG